MYFQILFTIKFLWYAFKRKASNCWWLYLCCEVEQWIQLCLYWRGTKGLKSSCFFVFRWMTGEDQFLLDVNAWVFSFHCICERCFRNNTTNHHYSMLWLLTTGFVLFCKIINMTCLCSHVTFQIVDCQSDLPLMASIFHIFSWDDIHQRVLKKL